MALAFPSNDIAFDFVQIAALAGMEIQVSDIDIEELATAHRQPKALPIGKQAVYLFMYRDRCLKVGKAGPKSSARYCSQHYGLRAPSTLAKSLIRERGVDGATAITDSNVRSWICEHTDRVNFLIPERHGIWAISLLEVFLQCRLRPRFEGFASQRMLVKIDK